MATMSLTGDLKYLQCMFCGKRVSTGFVAVPTETPDGGIIVRAAIECPECIEGREGHREPLEPVILQILTAMADWQFLAGGGGPTRASYFALRDAIAGARKAASTT